MSEPVNEESGDEEEVKKAKKPKPKKEKKLTKEQIAEIETMIDNDRRKLEEQKDMEVDQRDKIKVREFAPRVHLRLISISAHE